MNCKEMDGMMQNPMSSTDPFKRVCRHRPTVDRSKLPPSLPHHCRLPTGHVSLAQHHRCARLLALTKAAHGMIIPIRILLQLLPP